MIPSPKEVEEAKTPNGGWTKAQLAEWGITWPPQKGWRKELREMWEKDNSKVSVSAMERLRALIKQRDALISELQAWRETFLQEYKYAIQEDDSNVYEITNFSYWNSVDSASGLSIRKGVKDIYKELFGKQFVPQKLIDKPCPACGDSVYATSMAQEKNIENHDWYSVSNACCNACHSLELEHQHRTENVLVYPNYQIHELSTMNYKEFLKTDYWKAVREFIVNRDGKRCKLCGDYSQSLHVHHNTYSHRGYEFKSDLITLCKGCHAKFHDKEAVQ